jgi:voltage-gated potassium channel Kch
MHHRHRGSHTKRELITLLLLFLVVIVIGVLFYHSVEKLNWIDAFYLTSLTLTTVGYGDITPQTDIGKIFTSIYAFLGIATFLGVASILFHNTIGVPRSQNRDTDDDYKD